MSEDFQQQTSDFRGMWIGDRPEKTKYFDLTNIQLLQKEYEISDEFAMVALLVLEFAALGYWQETERANADLPKLRKDLRDLEQATTKLVNVLNGLPPEALRVLHEAKVARRFQHHSAKEIGEAAVRSVMHPQPPNSEASKVEPGDESNVDRLRTELVALADEAQKAQKWVGTGKPGRKNDDGAADLMQACFLVWTEMIGREFTLAWYQDGADSDAARFCVDIAGIVDPKLSASRVITASRKVRENDFGIKDLDKRFEDTDQFHKRLD